MNEWMNEQNHVRILELQESGFQNKCFFLTDILIFFVCLCRNFQIIRYKLHIILQLIETP